ncbi:MAG: hypothetical protein NUV69_00200 [Candidatus Curtissbacteria bacterium]|nr:hypothetical protein [Candidatus Curtissbacteria bacterium]
MLSTQQQDADNRKRALAEVSRLSYEPDESGEWSASGPFWGVNVTFGERVGWRNEGNGVESKYLAPYASINGLPQTREVANQMVNVYGPVLRDVHNLEEQLRQTNEPRFPH